MTTPSATVRAFDSPTDIGLAEDPMLQLTRVFVYFLQNLFREAPEGCGMRWRPNEESSEILISDQKPLLDAVEKKPHITCVFGAGEWGGLGLDQMQSQKMMGAQERVHTDLFSSTMSYHCQSRAGIHSRRVAWRASYFTNVFRRILIRGGGLHQVGVRHKIGPESGPSVYTGPLAEEKIISVLVTIPFYWQPQWLIKDPGTVFRQFSMNLGINPPAKRYSAGDLSRIRGARIKGVPLVPVSPKPQEPSLSQTVKDDKFVGEE